MAKFGTTGSQDDSETIEKRRLKFGNTSSAMVNEDEETLNKRKERFGLFQSDKQVEKDRIEERKRKFGDPEKEVNLDE